MSAITVRPFRRSDRDQLTDLINGHAQAVVPGVSITVNSVLGRLEHEPDEYIVGPWVQERATVVGEQRGRITAAAHVVRYGEDDGVGETLRGTGEIRWLLQWPDTTLWPDAGAAGQAVGEAALGLLRSWNVTRILADGTLPAPGLSGTAEQWPHLNRLLERLGFVSGRSEHVLLADVMALPMKSRDDVAVVRTLGDCGTRFTATGADRELGFIEVDTSIGGNGRIAAPAGWADIGNLHVPEDIRGQGIGTALVVAAARWLRLAQVDRVLAYAETHETDLVAFLQHVGFDALTTCRRQWEHVGHTRSSLR